ncbi:unnamed protein product, partial [Rhizoctonia solani]
MNRTLGIGSSIETPLETEYPQTENTSREDPVDAIGSQGDTALSAGMRMSPEELYELGQSCIHRFRRFGKLDDLQEAFEYSSRALELTPKDHQDLPHRFASLGTCFYDRFQRLGELDDIEKSIKYNTRALNATPSDHPDLPRRLTSLGSSYYDRFQRLGELDDLERVIEYDTRALGLTPNNHPGLPDRLVSLGSSYYDRFHRLGELGDIEKAIEYETRALELTPNDHSDFPERCGSLGQSYYLRFQRMGQLDDIKKSIKHGTRALDLTPSDHPDLPRHLACLGSSYYSRFQRLGDLDDIKKSIEYEARALDLTPSDHPDLPDRLASLGQSYYDQFQRLGELDDIERAIEYKTRALDITPSDHPELSRWVTSLGSSYFIRFQRLGELDDIERSIEYKIRALNTTPSDHPDLPHRLDSLGQSYYSRYQRLGELDDIKKSIKYETRAITLTPSDYPDLPHRLGSLGQSYYLRFQRLGEMRDIEKSIEYDTRALDLTPSDHPHMPLRLANLGLCFHSRFQRLDELGDIDKSIEYNSRAFNLTPNNHPHFPDRLVSLGSSYYDRFRLQGDVDDIEGAIGFLTHARDLTPADHPYLPSRHYLIANVQFSQFQLTGDSSVLQDSLTSFRRACQSKIGAPRDRFRHAFRWAIIASTYTAFNPIEAHQTAINLLPQFIWLGATPSQRYQDLLTATGLAINAASAAISVPDYHLAVKWLEDARCVVWNQSLMLRTPLDQLQSSNPDLATRLQIVANQLYTASSESAVAPTLPSDWATQEQHAQQRRRLAKEYNELLSRAREIPGFKDFLRLVNKKGLTAAARNGPIVVLNCHENHGDALIIMPGKQIVRHLPLKNCSQEEMRQAWSAIARSLRSKGIRERGIKLLQQPGQKDKIQSTLLTLWKDIVKPVLDFLGYTDKNSTSSLPHITWCPTGPMSFLPLHAAGDYDQPGSSIFDHVISSYTPTLTALLVSTPNTLTPTSRVLAIGQTNTPGRNPLPGTATELEHVRAHTHNKVEYSELIDDQATIATVLDAMEHHDWVHLACHAHQNVNDPTKSGFFLHDGTLDLASINRRSFRNKGLAFLSACQTATGDEKLPDEAIHLASGMLMAGYSSVIATMWSVSDSDAPFVADKVYAELMKDGKVGNGEAGRALHYAIAALREQ